MKAWREHSMYSGHTWPNKSWYSRHDPLDPGFTTPHLRWVLSLQGNPGPSTESMQEHSGNLAPPDVLSADPRAWGPCYHPWELTCQQGWIFVEPLLCIYQSLAKGVLGRYFLNFYNSSTMREGPLSIISRWGNWGLKSLVTWVVGNEAGRSQFIVSFQK